MFKQSDGFEDLPMTVPCGQCIGCRLDRSKQWAVRCYHEAQLHEDNCFITLTYNDVHLPRDLSCDYRVFQLFMKRLRKKYGKGIRFFHCGEYGEQNGRPHYHAILFNHDFEDKVLWQEKGDNKTYVSADLAELWPYGFSTVAACTFQTAAYCARYIMKKVTGTRASDHYTWTDPISGETHERKPEYCQMSLKPGLGLDWYRQYRSDLWPDDFCVVDGKKYKIPAYYGKQLEKEENCNYVKMKEQRAQDAIKRKSDNTKERLAVRHKCTEAKVSTLKRGMT